MQRLVLWVALCVVALVVGCNRGGGTSSSSSLQSAPPSAANAKAALEGLAKDGRIGSGTQAVSSYISSLRATDPAKADALEKDYKELSGLIKNQEAFKAKAKALADKL